MTKHYHIDPNVIYDEDNSDGQGKWRCWYGDCVSGCGTQARPLSVQFDSTGLICLSIVQILLYANSSDGLIWEKPELGLYDVKNVRKDLAQYGKANNIIMKGGGLGIYKDPHEVNSSRKFKCFGEGCAGATGTAVSADGLIWTDPKPLSFPTPQVRFATVHGLVLILGPWSWPLSAAVRLPQPGSVCARGAGVYCHYPRRLQWKSGTHNWDHQVWE